MAQDFTDQAEQLVKLVRAYTTTEDEAVDLIRQALRTAHSGGVLEGGRQMSEGMMRTFDAATLITPPTPDQEAYLREIDEQSRKPVDLTKVVGGPR